MTSNPVIVEAPPVVPGSLQPSDARLEPRLRRMVSLPVPQEVTATPPVAAGEPRSLADWVRDLETEAPPAKKSSVQRKTARTADLPREMFD
ncbi:MAG: hypothetical protein HY763_02035 [Planctomycetes bacterium]|nr:hypothetical protein [Planctomycetota bacterium]